MRESLRKEFYGRVLNPSGVEIDLPFWVFKRLKKLHLLERDLQLGVRVLKRLSGAANLPCNQA